MEEEKFDFWAICELFGHSTIAGRVTTFGEFIRIDVPAVGLLKPFTKFYGSKAIYAITPTTEEIATKAAEKLSIRPVSLWIVPQRALPEAGGIMVNEPWEDQE